MVQLRANTRGFTHLKVVNSIDWSVEVSDNIKNFKMHIAKLIRRLVIVLNESTVVNNVNMPWKL